MITTYEKGRRIDLVCRFLRPLRFNCARFMEQLFPKISFTPPSFRRKMRLSPPPASFCWRLLPWMDGGSGLDHSASCTPGRFHTLLRMPCHSTGTYFRSNSYRQYTSLSLGFKMLRRFQLGSDPSLRFRFPAGLILISPIWVLMDFSLLQQKLIPWGSLHTGSIQFPGNFIRRLFAKISGSHDLLLRQPDNITYTFATKAKHTLLCACC